MEKSNSIGAVVLLLLLIFGAFALDAHAEDAPAAQADPSTAVTVTDPELSSKLDTLQESLDSLVTLLTPAEGEPDATPAPDYTTQLSKIETTLSNIESTVMQATAETAEPAVFEKPFSDYSTTETLLLILSAFALLAFFLYFVSKFF